jgi:hypothetical protein
VAPVSPNVRARFFIFQNVSIRNGARMPPSERPPNDAMSSSRQAWYSRSASNGARSSPSVSSTVEASRNS